MPNLHAKKTLGERFQESKSLWITGAVIFVVGFGTCYGSYRIPATKYPFLAGATRDIGMALCISVLVGVLIEVGLAHRLFENTINAMMNETVSKEVWNEIRVHMLSQEVIRNAFHVTMDIKKESEEYVSTTTLEYDIKSRHGAFDHPVEHELDSHRNLPNSTDQRFTLTLIDGRDSEDKTYTENGLKVNFPVKFKKGALKRTVLVRFRELVHKRDVINWWMSAATVDLTIIVKAPPEILAEAIVHHPDKTLLKPSPEKQAEGTRKWDFQGVMLPGQGFEIRLQPNESKSPLPAAK